MCLQAPWPSRPFWALRRLGRNPVEREACCRPAAGRLSLIRPTACCCCSIIRRACSRPSRTTLLKIPVITTASEPNGPNGPLMPEIQQFAPHAVYVGRKGEVNAWDNEDFVNTVRATGKKTLIMAGVWTSVCVMFPALDAKAAGFKVYAVIDASGDPSELASRTTLARFIQAGIVPTSTNAVLSETHRTWNRPEAAELAKLYALAAPNYGAVIESYEKAKDVGKQSK